MTDTRNNSGMLLTGVMGGVLGGLVAVLLSDDKRRGRLLGILTDLKDKATSQMSDATEAAEHKVKRVTSKE